MRTPLLAVLLLGLLTALSAQAAQDSKAEPPKPNPESGIVHWMKQARVPGVAMAHVRDGKIHRVQVFGESAPEVPLTADTYFNVASLTKPVFGLLVLHMVAQGQWGLDAAMAEHWVDPDIAADPRRLELTPRLALSHQTGFPNWRGEKGLAFTFAPGTRFEYSGEGFEYTRRALEEKTSKTLPDLMAANILKKAGMSATSFGWSPALEGKIVGGYNEAGKPMDLKEWKTRAPRAASSMFSTVEDYARFAIWVMNGADLPRALQDEMARSQARHANPAEDFGIGWRLIKLDKETVLAHDGRERGLRTQVFVLPKSKEALVLFTNSNNGELMVKPAVEATLARGPELLRRIDMDVWTYLLGVPQEQFGPMTQGISRSPAFMSKFLHAADAALVESSGLAAAERAAAAQAIDPFVTGMLQGTIDQATAKKAFDHVLENAPGGPRLRTRFTAEQAGAWLAYLRQALEAKPVIADAAPTR